MKEDEKYTLSIDKKYIRYIKMVLLVSVILIVIIWAFNPGSSGEVKSLEQEKVPVSPVVKVSATEIYPLFLCPCCGLPLDKENICCGLAKERIDYIDALTDAGISKQEIILTYVKKFGINSFIDESMKEEVRAELARRAPADRPKILINPVKYDFGDVSVAKGVVSTTMIVVNEGKSDLVLYNIETSCMCTTAQLIVNGRESYVFGMDMGDGKHPTGWSETIPSGQNAELKIYYDPTMHEDQRGPLTRTISVFSNDPVDFEYNVRIEANQID
ncbi:MAG: DUF1573 domain-containing protein [Candidatus Hydrothermarchaeales archaeon]